MKKINVCKPFPADTSKKSDLLKTYNDSQNPYNMYQDTRNKSIINLTNSSNTNTLLRSVPQ